MDSSKIDAGYTVDDLIRLRASEADQVPILGYPKTERGLSDYERFTALELDRFVDSAAKKLMAMGLAPVVSQQSSEQL